MSHVRDERAKELLADLALEGLSEAEAEELAALLGGDEDSSFDEAAAAVFLATGASSEPLPSHLAAKVEADARRAYRAAPDAVSALRPVPRAGRPERDLVRYAGWFAAAACLALAVASWLRPLPPAPVAIAPPPPPAPAPSVPPPSAPPSPVSKASEREQLLAERGTVQIEWSATKDLLAKGASGDVVWNEKQQRGYMRFRGLRANNPSKSQYQLWIFDPSQSASTPIDGGVFDVDRETGDVVVAITPKLHVTKPSLFAVTVEKPGGVVVSKREHIVVVAPVKA